MIKNLSLFEPDEVEQSQEEVSQLPELNLRQSRVAEMFVQMWLVGNGHVSTVRGAEGQSHDLIVVDQGKARLVQVKSSSRSHGHKIRFRILSRQGYSEYQATDFHVLALAAFRVGGRFPYGLVFLPYLAIDANHTCLDMAVSEFTLDNDRLLAQWLVASGGSA